MKLLLPSYVTDVMQVLENAGYEAYAVGGCVRDLLLGTIPADYDLASNCPPERVLQLFDRCFATGIQHGTVTVLYDQKTLEVTRYRIDCGYSDCRRPDAVLPAGSLDEDLSRRDFTINAMAYHPVTGLRDPFGGNEDLHHKRICAVGDPQKRFAEDALRILRAFRFAARLSFAIEEKTLAAALGLCGLLEKISVERIFSELMKLLEAPAPSAAEPLIAAGGLAFIGLKSCTSLKDLDKLPKRRELRFAALCLLCGSEPDFVAAHLKADNRLRRLAGACHRELSLPPPPDSTALKRAFLRIPPPVYADILAARQILFGEDTGRLLALLETVLLRHEPWKLSMLAIDGNDLLSAQIPSRKIGGTLEQLLAHVIDRPEDNRREILIGLAKGMH